MKSKFYDIPQLRQKIGIFQDRRHAGQVLAEMLHEWKDSKAVVLAIPSGGIPVAVEVAETLYLSLDVAVVSKILLPWNTGERNRGHTTFSLSKTVPFNRGLSPITRALKKGRIK